MYIYIYTYIYIYYVYTDIKGYNISGHCHFYPFVSMDFQWVPRTRLQPWKALPTEECGASPHGSGLPANANMNALFWTMFAVRSHLH